MRDVVSDLSLFLVGHAFDAETTHGMEEAFDRVMHALPETGQSGLVRELVAKHVIAIVEDGERNPRVIEQRALEHFGFAR